MRIVIGESSEVIPYSDLISATLRTDLMPVPLSIEFSVNNATKYSPLLAINKEIYVADYNMPFIITKSVPVNTQAIKDNNLIGAVYCIAIAKPFLPLTLPLKVAKIIDQTSFKAVLRSVGVVVKYGNDIPLDEFIALCGSTPSERLATYMHQEACVICLRQEKVNFLKVDSFFKQDEILKVSASNVAWLHSEQKDIIGRAVYSSVADDGETIIGETQQRGFKVIQKPRLSSRKTKNMEKVLVTRGIIVRTLDMSISAGDVISIDDKKYVILTSAHNFTTGNLGNASQTLTKLWIATL